MLTLAMVAIIVTFAVWIGHAHDRISDLERKIEDLRGEIPPDPAREEIRRAAAAWDAREAAEKAAKERNEHNREVKRRRKERKAAAIKAHEHERNLVILRAVKESLDQEQIWRDRVAKEHGWPHHPNDMDWLNDEQRKDMFKVFGERGPFKDEWVRPDDYESE